MERTAEQIASKKLKIIKKRMMSHRYCLFAEKQFWPKKIYVGKNKRSEHCKLCYSVHNHYHRNLNLYYNIEQKEKSNLVVIYSFMWKVLE